MLIQYQLDSADVVCRAGILWYTLMGTSSVVVLFNVVHKKRIRRSTGTHVHANSVWNVKLFKLLKSMRFTATNLGTRDSKNDKIRTLNTSSYPLPAKKHFCQPALPSFIFAPKWAPLRMLGDNFFCAYSQTSIIPHLIIWHPRLCDTILGKFTIKEAKGAHLEGKIRTPNSVFFWPNSQQNLKILWKSTHNAIKFIKLKRLSHSKPSSRLKWTFSSNNVFSKFDF
jgi:hypothetical protein